ncbi:MAG: GtrA family protein [Candidatus Methanomethyliaceae archaeon]|jgi:putative flippase GtrA
MILSLLNLRYFVGYLAIGLLNMAVGYSVIFGLMYLGLGPFMSNFAGYAVGISVSYALNKSWNFKSKRPHREAYPRFVGLLALAYLANLCVLHLGINVFRINGYVSQMLGGIVYTVIGFLGSRYVIFSRKGDSI